MLLNYIMLLDDLKCIVVILFIVLIYSFVFQIRSTYYHEFSHAFVLRKYDKISEVIIARSYSLFKKRSPKICKKWSLILYKYLNVRYVIKLYIGRRRSGEIVVCNNFIDYEDSVIRKIALGGMIGSLLYGFMLSIVFSFLFGSIFFITFFTPVFVFLCNFVFISKSKWTDARIVINPKGFKEAIKNKNIPKESTYEFYRNILNQIIKE